MQAAAGGPEETGFVFARAPNMQQLPPKQPHSTPTMLTAAGETHSSHHVDRLVAIKQKA
jgi:hypothetical protein